MLVIRRRVGESIVIGGDVTVEVLDITPTRVKLGVTAHPTVPVVRPEQAKAAEQNLLAVGSHRTADVRKLAQELRQIPFGRNIS
jgi:carbon storage regulator